MKTKICTVALYSISMLVLVFSLLALDIGSVSANGTPHKIILTYLPGLSNWGPSTATGIVEVVPKEGQVSISVVGLPSLTNENYTGWLINARNNQSINVGRFNTDAAKTATVNISLPSEIPDIGWNLFLLTVEPDGQTAKSPGERKSIGGYVSDSAEGKQIPAQLPRTGGDTDSVSNRTNRYAPPDRAPQAQPKYDIDVFAYGIVFLFVIGLGMFARVGRHRG